MAHHYCEFRVDGDAITVRAIEVDGSVIEQFSLRSDLRAL